MYMIKRLGVATSATQLSHFFEPCDTYSTSLSRFSNAPNVSADEMHVLVAYLATKHRKE